MQRTSLYSDLFTPLNSSSESEEEEKQTPLVDEDPVMLSESRK